MDCVGEGQTADGIREKYGHLFSPDPSVEQTHKETKEKVKEDKGKRDEGTVDDRSRDRGRRERQDEDWDQGKRDRRERSYVTLGLSTEAIHSTQHQDRYSVCYMVQLIIMQGYIILPEPKTTQTCFP